MQRYGGITKNVNWSGGEVLNTQINHTDRKRNGGINNK